MFLRFSSPNSLLAETVSLQQFNTPHPSPAKSLMAGCCMRVYSMLFIVYSNKDDFLKH